MDTQVTALERERRAALNSGTLIDLIDTNFQRNGLRFPAEVLIEASSAWFNDRLYQPDPKGSLAARHSIADFYRNSGTAIHPDHIIICASASECYSLLFQALSRCGDGVVLPRPGYPLFEHVAGYMRLNAGFYATRFEQGFRLNGDDIAAALTSATRFVVLISPNNPTGHVASDAEIDQLLALCARHNLALICDEVFSDLLYESGSLPRPMSRAADAGVVVFTINGVSKLFASPDLKLSWIAVSGPGQKVRRAVADLELANDMYLNCSPLSQQLLPTLFAAGGAFRRTIRSELAARRQILLDDASRFEGLDVLHPAGGIHAVARFHRPQDDERFALQLLCRSGVHLHPGYLYGLDEDRFVVLSFLKERALLHEGLGRIAEFLRRAA